MTIKYLWSRPYGRDRRIPVDEDVQKALWLLNGHKCITVNDYTALSILGHTFKVVATPKQK